MAHATGSMKAQRRRSDEEVPSTSSTPQQTTLPLYYVERPGVTHHTASGAMITPGPNVPLIAVDQLPAWVDVLGVPRELSREQVANLSLSRVGVAPKGKAYEVYIVPAPPPPPPPPPYDDAKIRHLQMDPTVKRFTSQKGRAVSVTESKDGHFTGHMKKDNITGAGMASGDATGVRQPVGLHQRPPSPPAVDPLPDNPYPVLYPTTVSSYRTQDTVQRRRKDLRQEHPAERLRQAYHKKPSFRRSANTSLLSRSPSLSPSSSSTMTIRGPGKYTGQHDSNRNSNSNKSKSNNNNNNHASSSRRTHNNGTTKIYCRHWCHTGRCKWDDACRYRHDMPNTARELREVGLDGGYPGWWETHLRLVSKQQQQHANLGVVHAAAQHVRPRSGPNGSDGGDAGTMGSIAGLYPYPMNMNMNMNMGTAAGIQGMPLGHMMTGAAAMMPGFYHQLQFHNDAPASAHAHIPLGLHGSGPLSSSGGKKSKKQFTLQQQQRRDKHKDIEYKHNGSFEHEDEDDDDADSSTAEEEYQHRATTTATKKPKPISAKKRARGSSRSGASISAYPSAGHTTDSSSPSPSPSPNLSGSTTSGSSDVDPKQATAPKGGAQGGEKARQPRSRMSSQARNISRQNHRHHERSDPRTRIPTQHTRRVSHPPDIFEHEIEMALAAAGDEEKRKQEEAAAERQKRPALSSSGKERRRNDSRHDDQKGQNTSKVQGQTKGEEDEIEKLVDI